MRKLEALIQSSEVLIVRAEGHSLGAMLQTAADFLAWRTAFSLSSAYFTSIGSIVQTLVGLKALRQQLWTALIIDLIQERRSAMHTQHGSSPNSTAGDSERKIAPHIPRDTINGNRTLCFSHSHQRSQSLDVAVLPGSQSRPRAANGSGALGRPSSTGGQILRANKPCSAKATYG